MSKHRAPAGDPFLMGADEGLSHDPTYTPARHRPTKNDGVQPPAVATNPPITGGPDYAEVVVQLDE